VEDLRREIGHDRLESSVEVSSNDEDTSDEAFQDRHERVLRLMREKWARRKKIKQDQKEQHLTQYAPLHALSLPDRVNVLDDEQPVLSNVVSDGGVGVFSPRKRAGSYGSRHSNPRKRGRPPKFFRSGSIDDGSPRLDGDENDDGDYYEDIGLDVSTPTPRQDKVQLGKISQPESFVGSRGVDTAFSRKKLSPSARASSASSIASMSSCGNSVTSPSRLEDADTCTEEDRIEGGW
jgi:hypothetical protein